MKLFRLLKLNDNGFSLHMVLPVLAVFAVAGVGTYLLEGSHAQTTTCRTYQFAASGTNDPSGSKISSTACVRYIQDMVNGAYQAASDTSNHNLGGYASVANLYAKYNGVATGTIKVDSSFGPITKSRVEAFQATYQYYSTSTKKNTDLGIDGTVGPNTWSALCGLSLRLPNADKGYKSHPLAQQANNDARKAASGCSGAGVNSGIGVHPHVPASVTNPPKSNTGGNSGGTTGGSTTLTLNQARDEYRSGSTLYGSAICTVISNWSITAAAKSAFPNCYYKNFGSSFCLNVRAIIARDYSDDNIKAAQSLSHSDPQCVTATN